MAQRVTGEVKWFNAEKGFGFIKLSDSDTEVFVHYSAIESNGYKSLNEGDKVEFEVVSGQKGQQASGVRVIQ